jgi:hypothetical protein
MSLNAITLNAQSCLSDCSGGGALPPESDSAGQTSGSWEKSLLPGVRRISCQVLDSALS